MTVNPNVQVVPTVRAGIEGAGQEGAQEALDGAQEAPQGQTGTQPQGDTQGAQNGAQGVPEASVESVPPEVLRQKLTEANQEAANYRVKLREATEALAKAKTDEDITKATQGLLEKIAALEVEASRRDAADKAGLPAELREFVTGSTPEEMAASAAKLAGFVTAQQQQEGPERSEPQRRPAPSEWRGGLNPTEDESVMDPAKLRKLG